MKAVVKSKPAFGAELREVEEPKPKENEVLVKIKHAGICGTDVHVFEWNEWAQGRIKPPLTMGHEFVGEIVEAGRNVDSVAEGEMVTAESHIVCGKCVPCKNGQMEVCEKTKILGVDTDGVFSDFAVIPEFNAWRVEKGVPLEFAAAQEPLGNSVHAVMSNDIAAKNVVIFGAGPTGLFAVGIAKKLGAQKVLVVEKSDYRLQLAKKMGADRTLNVNGADVVKEVLSETDGRGADVALEMAGNVNALYTAIKVLRPGGELTLFGLPSQKAELNIADLVFKGLKIHCVIGRKLFDTWFKSTGLIKAGLDISPALTHRFKMEEFEKGMELMLQQKSGKILLSP